ncbi:hypothetical protein ACJMK2_033009 [Sinanodonta woodiana]|uniref:Uncharacterized protein n=1 Tax=Sinanodonta woodiana TaxID=1069815 RepID=A0ABD3X7H7_SINWO
MWIEEHGSKLLYTITKTWDNRDTGHAPIHLTLQRTDVHHVQLTISAPYFNDPPNPGGTPGKPFQQLWDYEVVEAFFLSDDGKYLELEFCPHGQHLVLLLNGRRNMWKVFSTFSCNLYLFWWTKVVYETSESVPLFHNRKLSATK